MIYRSRKMVKGADLNGAGSLFGGVALAWIDEEAAIYALCQLATHNVVTKAMSSIDFKSPAKIGDIVEIGCETVRFGRTSITVKCSMRNKTTQQDIITVEEIVFVNMIDGIPSPHGVTNNPIT
ncbi:acyl-CoA thioesterase [Xanthomonas phage Xoo-sp13]|nr:acyl-CoA thioesterase [Xanthomonas phage Xoo-sp13]